MSIESPSVVSFPPEPTTTMPTIYSDGPDISMICPDIHVRKLETNEFNKILKVELKNSTI